MFLIFAKKKIAKIRHYFFNSNQKQHFHEYFPLKLQIKVILIDTKSTTWTTVETCDKLVCFCKQFLISKSRQILTSRKDDFIVIVEQNRQGGYSPTFLRKFYDQNLIFLKAQYSIHDQGPMLLKIFVRDLRIFVPSLNDC